MTTTSPEKPHLLITAPVMPAIMDALPAAFTTHRWWEMREQDTFVATTGRSVVAMATSNTFPMTDAFMARFPALRQVSSFGVGYDSVDAAAAARRGIVVTNTPDVLNEEVADTALGLILCTMREFPRADAYLRAGRWLDKPYPLTGTLRDRRVGILGLGRIGKAIARRLDAFGVPVSYHGRTPQPDVPYPYHASLLAMARDVNMIVVVAPGGAATNRIVNADVLTALGPDGVLINVGRGSVVDEEALVNALRTGTIRAAGLDVFEDEPRVPQALVDMPQVVLFPHVGSGSHHTRAAMAKLVVDNLLAFAAGRKALTPVPETST